MDDVTHLGTITVWGNNPREHLNDYFNNYDNAHEDIDLTGRYEKLKCILHENLYDNIKLTDIHDDVNNHKVDIFKNPSIKIKDNLKSKQTLIENDLIILRKDIAEIEKSPGWKFIIDPQKYPCTYKWHFQSSDSSKLKISATFKFRTIEDRDRLLADDFDDNIPGIPRFPFDNIDLYIDAVNKRADRDARNQLLEIKRQHKNITDKIQFNVNELNKLKIAQSSVFAVPTPNVPTLPHGVGSNSQVTQTADSSIAKGIEKALGNIRDGLAETFDCSFGMSCSNDLDKTAKNPNVGKELSNSDKVEAGGSGAGGPEGWEPDEFSIKNNDLPSKEELKQAASEINRNGLTNAGRSLQKHGGREGSAYSYSNQKASVLNQEARALIDEILDNPNVIIRPRTIYENRKRIEVIDAKSPDGRVLRFSIDGKKFIVFREP
ncbi:MULTISPECIES: hypothetical protein [Providencia]|uniref:Uncharacterized protein n=1 Tax=Providencia huaxiensis TaxID=2027290 RepID=A0ABU2IX51_9GAMM|nr:MULTISPECIES: hypothetical protein [Providencia]MBZ3681589.1 hypothetical protein [Providencia rettgeri]AXH64620.1 hypothetical protein CYG50_22700 [Providencia huaxiensis]MDT0132984.1 hypothetical protein [Providencia huaxiensis]MDT1979390.1 hypothetical protein [Providencia huaxiensis]QLR02473.1 hypothetical protein H0912_06900 [Providencia rettgeri]